MNPRPAARPPLAIATSHLRKLGLPCVRRGANHFVDLPALVHHPVSGESLEVVRLQVVGPDALLPVAPSLVQGLEAVCLLDAATPQELAAAVEARLQSRLEAARRLRKEMVRLRLHAAVKETELVATGEVELHGVGTVHLQGTERGLRAVRVVPPGEGAPIELDVAVDLAEHADRADLEVFLSHPAERALRAAPIRLVHKKPAEPADDGSASLGRLLDVLGAEARLHPDLSITREFQLAGEKLRFEARRDHVARRWNAAIVAPGRTLWRGPFDLASPPIETIAAEQLGIEPPQPAAPISLGPDRAFDGVAGQLVPVAGETWVMGLLVEGESADEIRYGLVDIDGKRFGPVRTMPPADFAATFQKAAAGWRLLARVLRVADERVEWVQLDPAGEPVGKVRAGALAMFVHHFLPQAAAY